MKIIDSISSEMNLETARVSAVVQLLDQGSTILLIARYRKEVTQSLDEVAIAGIRDRMDQLNALNRGERENIILNMGSTMNIRIIKRQ